MGPECDECSPHPQEEVAEKLAVVEVYNARLTVRERRRAFIRDRGLLNVRRMQVKGPQGAHAWFTVLGP